MASKRGSEIALWFDVTFAAESQPKDLFLGVGLGVRGWNPEMGAIIAVKGGKEMDSNGSKIGLFDWKRLLRTVEEHWRTSEVLTMDTVSHNFVDKALLTSAHTLKEDDFKWTPDAQASLGYNW